MNPADVAKIALDAGAKANDPVYTQAVGWSKAAYGIWTGVVMGALYMLPKFFISMRKLGYDRGNQLDDERKSDMAELRAEIKEVKNELREEREECQAALKAERERANAAEQNARDMAGKMASLIFGVEQMAEVIHGEWPDHPVLKSANRYIQLAKEAPPDRVPIA